MNKILATLLLCLSLTACATEDKQVSCPPVSHKTITKVKTRIVIVPEKETALPQSTVVPADKDKLETY